MSILESKHVEELLVANIEGVLDKELLKNKLTLFKEEVEKNAYKPWFKIDTTDTDVASIVAGLVALLIFCFSLGLFYFKLNPENNKFISESAQACSSGSVVECSKFYSLEGDSERKVILKDMYFKASGKHLLNGSEEITGYISREKLLKFINEP